MAQATLELVISRGTKVSIDKNRLDICWPEDSTPNSRINRKVLDMTDSETEALVAALKTAAKNKR